jgi:hypothetical protein
MIEYNLILNQIYKFIGFIVFISAAQSPETIGQWKAQMDIGYDSIWAEYVYDCDCTEALE